MERKEPSSAIVEASATKPKNIIYGDEVMDDDIFCEKCDDPVPTKRYQLTGSKVCVYCMEDMERNGQGTVRHRMDQIYHTKNGEEIEEVEMFIVRSK